MSFTNKYRPTSLKGIVGNQKIVKAITALFKLPDPPHAFLFTGKPGSGKTTFGRILSTDICLKAGPNDPNAFVNFSEINTADRRGIEVVRSVENRLQYRGLFEQPRIYFFDEAGCLTPEAQNVLLKTIEDAPEDVFFIFATSEPDKLLEPLKDRCAQYHLEPLTEEETVDLLTRVVTEEEGDVNEDTMREIAKRSGGHPRKAIFMLEEVFGLPADEQKDSLRKVATKVTIPSEKNPVTTENAVPQKPITHKGSNALPTPPFYHTTASKQFLKAIESIACTSTDLQGRKIIPPKSLMKPFLTAGALIMIFSEAGVGKTWFTQLVALVLTRNDCKGCILGSFEVEEQCGVMIIDGELSQHQIQGRISALAGPMGDENKVFPLVIVTSEEMVEKHGKTINLADESWRNAIYAYLEKNPANKLLILDNLASLILGSNENSKESWDPINQWLLTLRRLGVAVIILHHANKSGGYRGHSGKIDNLDTVISLKKMDAADELCFQVEYVKARTAKPGDARGFVLKAAKHPDNPDWLTWEHHSDTIAEEIDDDKDDQIMIAVMSKKMTQREIAKLFNVSQPKVSNIKRQAVERGFLTEKGELTAAGEEFLKGFDGNSLGGFGFTC